MAAKRTATCLSNAIFPVIPLSIRGTIGVSEILEALTSAERAKTFARRIVDLICDGNIDDRVRISPTSHQQLSFLKVFLRANRVLSVRLNNGSRCVPSF